MWQHQQVVYGDLFHLEIKGEAQKDGIMHLSVHLLSAWLFYIAKFIPPPAWKYIKKRLIGVVSVF